MERSQREGGYKDRLNTNLNPTHWMNYLRLVGALLSHHLSFSQKVPLFSFRAVSPEPSKVGDMLLLIKIKYNS